MPIKILVTTKVKKRKIETSTQASQKLQEDWDKMLERHSKPLEQGFTSKSIMQRAPPPVLPKAKIMPLGRPLGRADLSQYPSKSTPGGNGTKGDTPEYTGNKMIGLAVLHKSNTIPIFQAEDAVDIAKMRR